jgi:hypothetical protein
MSYQEMVNSKLASIREQIQEDLCTLNVKEEIKDHACQIVVDRFAELMTLLKPDTQIRVLCNNSLTK